MAYMNQERKAKLAAELRKVVPAGWKYTIAVRHGSTIIFTLREAPVDLIGEVAERLRQPDVKLHYQDRSLEVLNDQRVILNHHYLDRQLGASLPVFEAIKRALNTGNHDRSDVQTDYFDVGWYIDMQIGAWDKPFKTTAKETA